jgi:hypothetical protein
MPDDLDRITAVTIDHYDAHADAFWEGTRDHDVTQNYAALLRNLEPIPVGISTDECARSRE